MVTPAAGDGRMRVSHADREHVVDALKAAFVQGRLTRDELDARVGLALAARTYADLATLTADLPAEPNRTLAPMPARAQPPAARPQDRNRAANKAVKSGAGVIAAIIVVTSGTAAATGYPVGAVVLAFIIVLFASLATALVAALIALTLKVESRHQNRSRRQLPPGPV
jgi:hypothetical protein